MESIGKFLVTAGLILILIGGAVYLTARMGLPLGRLPGDIRIERAGGTIYFPLVSSIVMSLILTAVLNILLRLFHK